MATMLKTLFDIVGSNMWLISGRAKSPQCYVIRTFSSLLQYRIKFKKLDRKCYSDITNRVKKNRGAIDSRKCIVALL